MIVQRRRSSSICKVSKAIMVDFNYWPTSCTYITLSCAQPVLPISKHGQAWSDGACFAFVMHRYVTFKPPVAKLRPSSAPILRTVSVDPQTSCHMVTASGIQDLACVVVYPPEGIYAAKPHTPYGSIRAESVRDRANTSA